MIRGTTPTHIFNLPIATKTIKKIRITYAQNGMILLEKTEGDVVLTSTTIKLKLRQEDTLKFETKSPVQVQLKVLTTGDAVLAMPVKTIPVGTVLSEEVLG